MGAGLVAALFSLCNERLVVRHDKQILTLYEMIGACLLMTAASAFLLRPGDPWHPRGQEWIWMLLLSQVCTVFAFTLSLELLKKIPVFTFSLVANLEPVYGVLLAAALLQEHKSLQPAFWIGGCCILLTVIVYPRLALRRDSRAAHLDRQ
jgi:drug/metabolite transporter (DMT)-like permease